MRWLNIYVILFCLSLLPANAWAAKLVNQPEDIESITVLAPSNMAAAITELCKIYSLKKAKDVNAVFDSSSNNVENIEDGDPADIVITPSRKWFDVLNSKGLIDSKTTKILAADNLSIAASKYFNIGKFANAGAALNAIYNKALLVAASPESDALGEYTVQSLAKLGLAEKFAGRTVVASSSSSAVDLIIKGQTVGIVFSSDLKLFNNELKTVAIIPAAMHKDISYFAAVVVGDDMAAAREFLGFLASNEAKLVLKNMVL